MSMKIIFALLLTPALLRCQTGSLIIRVVDNVQEKPVWGMVLTIPELHRSDTTNDSGLCRLKNVPPGRYSVETRKIGFRRASYLNISVVPDSATQVTIQVEADDPMSPAPVVRPGDRDSGGTAELQNCQVQKNRKTGYLPAADAALR
ncbi:MAG TPA: carboxypeptidase-like regulatory domain-containing protein [Bacteroidota bacterium]|nr:carboxypeptidase-like regulatory domain-containing protein [Bacteroidota bacterium]